MDWRGKKKSLAVDGGLIIARCQAVAKALGLESFTPGMLTGHDQRTVLVVLSPPPPPDSAAARLEGLEGELEKHVADQAKTDSANVLQISNLDDRVAYVENQFGNIHHLSLGVGIISVYYSQNNYAVVPTLLIEGELTNHFGWRATGGILPTESEMFDGVASLAIFVKPISFVKIYSGYLLESYFDKDFQWVGDTGRTDAATLSVGFEKSYKKVSGGISLGGLRDFRNGRWGVTSSVGMKITF